MGFCHLCGQESPFISSILGVCRSCLLTRYSQAKELVVSAHSRARKLFNLPPHPPREPNGLSCNLCVNRCQVGEGERGYCAVRINRGGRWELNQAKVGFFSAYHDPLPTNCVADWVCPGGSSTGYPQYSYTPGAEVGYSNLAVFFHSCTFNCLYCQNWHYREILDLSKGHTAEDLVRMVDKNTSCICYFGGDPVSQLPFALFASKRALKMNQGRILRVCWETNGSFNSTLINKIAQITQSSGGCLKIDLKAWHEEINLALCGVSNKWTLENFKRLGKLIPQRANPPFLIASTLLVPGYIDEVEIAKIAEFIVTISPEIPYALLAFHPQFLMKDLPPTPLALAERCYQVARKAGLRRVRLGNIHLLS